MVEVVAARPPNSQIAWSSTVEAANWRADGASRPLRHLRPDTVGEPAGALPKSRASTVRVEWTWPVAAAPSIAYSESPTAATAVPWRGVRIAGSFDHLLVLRSKDCTASITLVGLSPPTATSRPATTAAPSPPAAIGMSGSFFQLSLPGS